MNRRTTCDTLPNAMAAYSCRQIAEFDWLLRHPHLREGLMQRLIDEDARLQEATRLVELHVLKRVPYRGSSASLIADLYGQGIDQAALASALAQAWLSGRDEFLLPKESWAATLNSTWMRLLVSFVLTLLLLITGVRLLSHINPELDTYLLAIPPLLAAIGFALTAVIFVLWSRLLKVFLGRAKKAEELK